MHWPRPFVEFIVSRCCSPSVLLRISRASSCSGRASTKFPIRPIFCNLSAHADGERRGLDRIGGWHRKGLGETCLQVPSDRHGSSAIAVGMLRDMKPKNKKNALGRIVCKCGCTFTWQSKQGRQVCRHMHRTCTSMVPWACM